MKEVNRKKETYKQKEPVIKTFVYKYTVQLNMKNNW